MSGGIKEKNANTPKTTEKYIERAYQKAKNLARSYAKTHSNTHLDSDDFTQEAMIAFLEGRNMGFGLIDAYRKAAPLTRSQVGRIPSPIFRQVFDHTLIDEESENALNRAVLTRQLREAIAQMEPINQDVIDRYYRQEQTLKEIGEAYGKSRTWVSNRIEGTIRKLQEELL